MDYSLTYHPDRYSHSFGQGALSLLTLSAPAVGNRHLQMAEIDPDHSFGHKLIGVIEHFPVLGALVAIIERLACAVFSRKEPSLVKNAVKALVEHRIKDLDGYATFKAAIPSVVELKNVEKTPLKFSHTFADAIGPRPTMEDAHFYQETDYGVLSGVFDGHGGAKVSKFASDYFKANFVLALKQEKGDVKKAFEQVINNIHAIVKAHPAGKQMGSTAVITYIDKQTQTVYTATLGDSEANIYRKIDGEMVSIPLSCVRDWTSKKDYTRLYDFVMQYLKPTIDEAAKKQKKEAPNFAEYLNRYRNNAKALRSWGPLGGVNVARSLGDAQFSHVIQKPKITINKLKKGDKIVIACDGLKDYVPEKSIAKEVARKVAPQPQQGAWDRIWNGTKPATHLAARLVQKALTFKTGDNVTVVAIEVS